MPDDTKLKCSICEERDAKFKDGETLFCDECHRNVTELGRLCGLQINQKPIVCGE